MPAGVLIPERRLLKYECQNSGSEFAGQHKKRGIIASKSHRVSSFSAAAAAAAQQ